jgi:hypothetical protein
VATAAVYVSPPQAHLVTYIGKLWPMPHLFEHHFHGSNLVEQAGYDFDGVLCPDCPIECDDDGPKYLDWLTNVPPLWVPRPCTIPLLVTARLSKYEQPTREWLGRNGVRVESLIFGPWATKAERETNYHPGQHKGLPFKTSGCRYFFESDERQARSISSWAHKPVIVPSSGKVFQGYA